MQVFDTQVLVDSDNPSGFMPPALSLQKFTAGFFWMTTPLDCRCTEHVTLLTILQATDPQIAATLILQHLQQLGLPAQVLAWEDALTQLVLVPPSPQDSRCIATAQAALQDSAPHDGAYLLPAHPGHTQQVVLVAPAGTWQQLPPQQKRWLEIAGQRLNEILTYCEQQAAIAQLEQSELLQHALFAIADLAGSAQDMDSLLKSLHEIVGALMYARNFFIALFDEQRQTLRFIYFVDEKDGPLFLPHQEIHIAHIEHSLTVAIIGQGQSVRGPSLHVAQALGLPHNGTVGTPSIDFMGVPMRRDGKIKGVMVVQSYQPGYGYTERDNAVLTFVAEHVLNTLERCQYHEALEQRVHERTQALALANQQLQEQVAERERAAHLQATLYRIAAIANEQHSHDQFYRCLHQAVGELLNAENFYIALLSGDGRTLEFPYAVDSAGEAGQTRPLGRGVSEYLIRQGHTLLLHHHDLHALQRRGDIVFPRDKGHTDTVCWLGAPLHGPHGVMGVVAVQSYLPTLLYSTTDADVLTFVSHHIAATVQRRRQAEALHTLNAELEDRVRERTQALEQEIAAREHIQTQLRHQVMHDPLTGLPNRVLLRDHLQRALHLQQRNPQEGFALLYLDIDRFKLFNDSLGHQAGDAVLREVSRRLQSSVRGPDIVARLSGDEFAILVDIRGKPESATRVAQRIQDRMQRPMQVAERELQVSISIGIALGDTCYNTIDEVLHDADVALYRAKAAGRQCFVLFDEEQQNAALHVLEVEQQLRKALQAQEFVPFFQPIVRLDDASTVGYEALIRWQHPQRGLLSPGEFLPIAEQTGLIESIDWLMYRNACLAARPLVQGGEFLTMNVSPRHFQNAELADALLTLLHDTGFAPAQLHVEVTENTLLGNPERVANILQQLQDAGVSAALDDFGTGYSSLGYVHRFPLKMIKIDRSFVHDLDKSERPRSAAIIEAVLGLGRALGLEVVAEGIETQAQRHILQGMGCTLGQGFFFGRPAPVGHWLTPPETPPPSAPTHRPAG